MNKQDCNQLLLWEDPDHPEHLKLSSQPQPDITILFQANDCAVRRHSGGLLADMYNKNNISAQQAKEVIQVSLLLKDTVYFLHSVMISCVKQYLTQILKDHVTYTFFMDIWESESDLKYVHIHANICTCSRYYLLSDNIQLIILMARVPRYFASISPSIWIITVQNWNKFATAKICLKFAWKYLTNCIRNSLISLTLPRCSLLITSSTISSPVKNGKHL